MLAATLGCGSSSGGAGGVDGDPFDFDPDADADSDVAIDERPAGEDSCDGFDDDGDGRVDEGCPCDEGAEQACYPGLPAEVGVGACVAGAQRCILEGEFPAWGACEGWAGPAEETCGDGRDDDCDGDVDEDCGCIPAETRPCYPGDAAEVGVGICREGLETCVAANPRNAWGDCEGAVTSEVEVCDDEIDQDCDGAVERTTAYGRSTGFTASGTTICCDEGDEATGVADCGDGDNHWVTSDGERCGTAWEGDGNYGGPCVSVDCRTTRCD